MAEKNYTLSYISELKGCTIEEFCQVAHDKGIDIPNDPDYTVSSSKLTAIDPQFAFNLKYGKVVSASKDKTDDSSKEELSLVPPEVYRLPEENLKVPKLNVLGKIDLSTLNQSSEPESKVKDDNSKSAEKKKTPKRVIGIVKFFDSTKGWGFVVSGNKGISGKPEDEGKLFSLHITSSEWKSSSYPRDNEWIILTPRKNARGWSALNAERLEYNRETLLFAMKYRGKYAKISGSDSKGDRYDENILCRIINQMTLTSRPGISRYSYGPATYDTTKFSEIIDAFCEYIAEMPIERQESTIKQFLEDSSLNKLLFKIFTEGEYNSEDSARLSVQQLYSKMLLNHIFESGKLSDLSKLPDTFDYSPHIDKLASILTSEALSENSAAVEKWLKEHDVLDKLVLGNEDTNTIPLRLILMKYCCPVKLRRA